MSTTHRCLVLGLVGAVVGVAGVAWAQEPAAASLGGDDAQFWLALVSGGGLPAVLGVLGVWLGRITAGGIPVTATTVVKLADEDRALLRQVVDHMTERKE